MSGRPLIAPYGVPSRCQTPSREGGALPSEIILREGSDARQRAHADGHRRDPPVAVSPLLPRGRAWITTTHAGHDGRPADLGDRQFVATRPNQLWVSDFTDVAEPVLH